MVTLRGLRPISGYSLSKGKSRPGGAFLFSRHGHDTDGRIYACEVGLVPWAFLRGGSFHPPRRGFPFEEKPCTWSGTSSPATATGGRVVALRCHSPTCSCRLSKPINPGTQVAVALFLRRNLLISKGVRKREEAFFKDLRQK